MLAAIIMKRYIIIVSAHFKKQFKMTIKNIFIVDIINYKK